MLDDDGVGGVGGVGGGGGGEGGHLYSGLPGQVGGPGEGPAAAAAAPGPGAAGLAAGRPDHGEVLGGRHDLPLGHLHVLAAARHDEHGLLAAHRGLDVGVGLGPQRLDLTAWRQ